MRFSRKRSIFGRKWPMSKRPMPKIERSRCQSGWCFGRLYLLLISKCWNRPLFEFWPEKIHDSDVRVESGRYFNLALRVGGLSEVTSATFCEKSATLGHIGRLRSIIGCFWTNIGRFDIGFFHFFASVAFYPTLFANRTENQLMQFSF